MNKILQVIKQLLFKQQPALPATSPTAARSEPEYDWQYLVTPGHTIFARMNHLSFVGGRLFLVLIASLGLFYFAFSTAANLLNKLDSFEKSSNIRPAIDVTKIYNGSRQFRIAAGSKPTAVSELRTFVTDNLTTLGNANKLAIPCNKSTSITGRWADDKGSLEYPMCSIFSASSGKPARIYTYAIVDANGQYKNWLGVFYKDKIWKYKNLRLAGFYEVPGYDKFDASLIVNTLKTDFPDLPIANQPGTQVNTSTETEYDYE